MREKNLFLKDKILYQNYKGNSIKLLSKKFDKIFSEIKRDIKNEKKTLNVLDSRFKFNFKIKDLKRYKRFKTIAIIGMGGSILGAEAIYDFFQTKIKKKFYFFNNLDENKVTDFKKKENLSKVLFVIISKSGNTVETLSNVFAFNILKKNSKNIILISEKHNLLFTISKNLNLFFIEHKSNIGGRYSVLSEVGIIPAYLMGINIFKLRSKILECLQGKNKIFLKQSTIKITNLIESKNFKSLVFINYFPRLEKFLYWCQQLVAESLGKKKKGFLPVISNAPKDHHSLLQLYLDGPKDKLFNIFSFDSKSKEKIIINKNLGIKNFLSKKNLSKIKNAQKKALLKSFLKKTIPFREFELKKANEEVLGKLFSFFIIETIIVGKLLKINPFNQPAVEQVKIYTKKYLT
ncbi:glucose-6-phosphate isomerase [Candidatus Pelagibacter bacterium]|nr:glucose-6-phosphate isomerase [Candidatus Pelagibacter bacterium]MDA9619027.1 glucose-6-phosphate isomerase [Candidatus Pelagibacter bacterium]